MFAWMCSIVIIFIIAVNQLLVSIPITMKFSFQIGLMATVARWANNTRSTEQLPANTGGILQVIFIMIICFKHISCSILISRGNIKRFE